MCTTKRTHDGHCNWYLYCIPLWIIHGAGIWIPPFAPFLWPSHVGVHIPAPWFAYGVYPCWCHRTFTLILRHEVPCWFMICKEHILIAVPELANITTLKQWFHIVHVIYKPFYGLQGDAPPVVSLYRPLTIDIRYNIYNKSQFHRGYEPTKSQLLPYLEPFKTCWVHRMFPFFFTRQDRKPWGNTATERLAI